MYSGAKRVGVFSEQGQTRLYSMAHSEECATELFCLHGTLHTALQILWSSQSTSEETYKNEPADADSVQALYAGVRSFYTSGTIRLMLFAEEYS